MPLFVRKLLDGYKDVISINENASWLGYGSLICGFLFPQASLSSIVRTCPWSPSLSSLQRATTSFDSKRFMKRLRSKILKYLKDKKIDEFCLVIDDTSIEKFSDKLPGFGKWATSSQNGYLGHKVLVSTIVNKKSGFAIPLFYKVLKKQDEREYENYTTIILNVINLLLLEGFPKF
jgi:hypothetical protein